MVCVVFANKKFLVTTYWLARGFRVVIIILIVLKGST